MPAPQHLHHEQVWPRVLLHYAACQLPVPGPPRSSAANRSGCCVAVHLFADHLPPGPFPLFHLCRRSGHRSPRGRWPHQEPDAGRSPRPSGSWSSIVRLPACCKVVDQEQHRDGVRPGPARMALSPRRPSSAPSSHAAPPWRLRAQVAGDLGQQPGGGPLRARRAAAAARWPWVLAHDRGDRFHDWAGEQAKPNRSVSSPRGPASRSSRASAASAARPARAVFPMPASPMNRQRHQPGPPRRRPNPMPAAARPQPLRRARPAASRSPCPGAASRISVPVNPAASAHPSAHRDGSRARAGPPARPPPSSLLAQGVRCSSLVCGRRVCADFPGRAAWRSDS